MPDVMRYSLLLHFQPIVSGRIVNASKTSACSSCIDDGWWMRASRLLEKRYELTQRLSTDSYSAEDHLLSQRVVVRRLRPACGLQGKGFLRALRSLTSVRHPNFLNVIDVLCSGGVALFITELPRGPSIAEILEKRSFDLADTMRLLPLTSFEFAAEHLRYPNTISTHSLYLESVGEQEGLSDFERQPISAWPPFIVRLEVSEVARPRYRFYAPFSADRREDVKRWTVRQTALLISELLGITPRPEKTVKSLRASSHPLRNESESLLSSAARGAAPFEDAESLLYVLELVAKDLPTSRPQKRFDPPRQKLVVNFFRSQSFLRFNAIGLTLGRVPLAFTRFIVLSALGATMVWLFSPSKHKPSLDSDRVQVASSPVSFRTSQATLVAHEPDPVASQSEPNTVASMPDQSPSLSPPEQPDFSQKESAMSAETSHHRFPASGGPRHRSANRGRRTFLHSKNRTLLQREIADFKVRLISLWRLSVFSGARHRKVSALPE
jgi:hypothetical protein